MKQLIVLVATLPILLLFIAQFTLEQQNAAAHHFVFDAVDIAKEQAKKDGCFTDDNIGSLKSRIANRLRLDKEEITVTATRMPRYRANEHQSSGQIHYRVEVPIKEVMAGARFLGIGDAQNRGRIVIEGAAASELLMP